MTSQFTGMGPVATLERTVTSIQEGDGLSIAANSASVGLDVLGALDNPAKTLANSAIGWILAHIPFVNDFLDWTTGNPANIEVAAGRFSGAAAALDQIAADQITAFKTELTDYFQGGSRSSRNTHDVIRPRADEIRSASLACAGIAEGITWAGALCATTRGIIFDLLVTFVRWVLDKGLTALAAAPYTGGSSLGVFIADTIREAAYVTRQIGNKLNDATQQLVGLSSKLSAMVAQLKAINGMPLRVAKVEVREAAKATDTVNESNDLGRAAQAEEKYSSTPTTPQKPWYTSGTLDD